MTAQLVGLPIASCFLVLPAAHKAAPVQLLALVGALQGGPDRCCQHRHGGSRDGRTVCGYHTTCIRFASWPPALVCRFDEEVTLRAEMAHKVMVARADVKTPGKLHGWQHKAPVTRSTAVSLKHVSCGRGSTLL